MMTMMKIKKQVQPQKRLQFAQPYQVAQTLESGYIGQREREIKKIDVLSNVEK